MSSATSTLDSFNPEWVSHIIDGDSRVRYKFRARTHGIEEYTCVFCGWLNRIRLVGTNWSFRCGNELCRRFMGLGRIGYILPPNGWRTGPQDLIIPANLQESFPLGDIGTWRSGQPIHRVGVLQWPTSDDQTETR